MDENCNFTLKELLEVSKFRNNSDNLEIFLQSRDMYEISYILALSEAGRTILTTSQKPFSLGEGIDNNYGQDSNLILERHSGIYGNSNTTSLYNYLLEGIKYYELDVK